MITRESDDDIFTTYTIYDFNLIMMTTIIDVIIIQILIPSADATVFHFLSASASVAFSSSSSSSSKHAGSILTTIDRKI